MITIIMSVGFSVDYSAHITYGYVISKEEDPRDRVRDALGDLGWPVVQGFFILSYIELVLTCTDSGCPSSRCCFDYSGRSSSGRCSCLHDRHVLQDGLFI